MQTKRFAPYASFRSLRRGFTIVELLVVIGIISVLMATMVVSLYGVTDSAKATVCMNNIRQLALAARNYATATASEDSNGIFPPAGSCEVCYINWKRQVVFSQRKGWISAAANRYDTEGNGKITQQVGLSYVSFDGDEDSVHFAMTNGVVWSYMDRDAKSYQCPIHVAGCRKYNSSLKDRNPGWSYVMNPQFGFDTKNLQDTTQVIGSALTIRDDSSLRKWNKDTYASCDALDRILLFAELPAIHEDENATVAGLAKPVFQGSGSAGDPVLDYMDGECIGFNHKVGKRYSGHVAFADGHAEKLVAPRTGNINELTRWLCQGCTLRFDGNTYVKESSPLE